MNVLSSAKLIWVWFCLLSEPSLYLAILQIFSNYKKKQHTTTCHFLGFFHRQYDFTHFFSLSRECVQQHYIHSESKRARFQGYINPTSGPCGQTG